MKYALAVLAVAFLAAGTVILYAKDEPAKPQAVTVKGEVVDLYCFLSTGARGNDHKECAVACAKAGNPIGLVDEKGNAYILMGKDKHQTERDGLVKVMAQTVTVKGNLSKSAGLQAIYVESIEK